MRQKIFFQLSAFIVISLCSFTNKVSAQTWNPGHHIGTNTGIYNFSYNQIPAPLVALSPAAIPATGLTYQWEQSTKPVSEFVAIPGATGDSYSLTSPLTVTTYFRRKSLISSTNFVYSNTIKLSVVSAGWEDINYIREHDVLTTNITTWTAIDQLAIGQKLQTTTYLDGLGRSAEKISKGTATPAQENGQWGDMVQFSKYDEYGRQPINYLPYTTTTASELGKYKADPLTEQPQYYTTTYNETSAFSSITFDNSPLNRVMNVKQPGTSWASAAGNTASYEFNTAADDIKMFTVDYVKGSVPVLVVNQGSSSYPVNSLYKLSYTGEDGKKVIEFADKSGRLILKKVQLDDVPSDAYNGWICTYSVYDDFGLLRYQIQPEGVKYLAANNWSFAGTNGSLILNEQCFQYYYDEKGRTTWKKAPGAKPLNMLYDIRDRVVFMQDGNQSTLVPTAQWTANLYDELDRPVITTLYNTNKTIIQLQTDIDNATSNSTISIDNLAQPITSLSVNQRQTNIPRYAATTSIDFVSDPGGDFESQPNDDFIAEIDPTATSSFVNVTTTVFQNPISAADLGSTSVCTILKYLFYDNYSFTTAKSFNMAYTNLSAYPTTDPNVIPIAKTFRTTSMPTGSMTRILGTATFLSATHYYDERGAHIQTLEDNIKNGTDITTLQYHFDGRVLSSCNNHSAPGTDYTNYTTLTKYLFDKLGRVTSIQKQFGTNTFKTISSYNYDDVGRVKTKHLDPSYIPPSGGGGAADLESLNYSYNIHNQITGINKDYALKTPGNYDKWGHFFGLYLGFDNRDNVFANANLMGQVTGQLWNTQGDDAQRKYDYTYDNAGRLVNATFNEKQHAGDTWSNAKMDFSVNGTSGKITYDLNGNLLNMLQKGVLPGTTTPITVDNLTYSYSNFSNKLQSVTDNMPVTSVNGQFGDFKDGTNTSGTPDYVYDDNGNLVIDLNKNAKDLANVAGANGIKYNFLDKPELIRIAGKGTIQIVYSADGEKLQRKFSSETDNTIKITTYINQFIYEETTNTAGTVTVATTLASINFEEGRIRVITPIAQGNGLDALSVDGNMDLPNGKRGAYDFFIMDYQQNVRMILTEEIHSASNTATMETNRSDLEQSIFGQSGSGNEVLATRFPAPTTWQNSSIGSSVSRLGTNATHNIGPNTLQKVMAGDQVSATVQYYYQAPAGGNNTNIVTNVLGSLVSAITGGATTNLVKGNAASIVANLNSLPDFSNAVQPNGSNPSGSRPQAYLTVLFFDERFNFIPAADGGVAQMQVEGSVTSAGDMLTLAGIKAPKNGYAYIYISNQSNNDVFFDNLQTGIVQGNIAEENHYYAYGLKIATLSSKKLGDSYEGSLKNNYLYNGKELLDEDADLGWLDYGFRNYDPQIGRFPQLDPLTFKYPVYTPYQFAGCEPIANVDVDGLEPANVIGFINELTKSGASNITRKIIQAGKYAGHWSVAWNQGGQAFAHVFKIAETATKAVGKVASMGSKIALSIRVVIAASKPLSCHGAYQQGFKEYQGGGGNSLFSWLRGNGGGIVETSEDGGNEETRKGYNADAEPVDISGLLQMIRGQKPDMFEVDIPKKLTNQVLDKLKKYIKGIEGEEERREYIIDKYWSPDKSKVLEPAEFHPDLDPDKKSPNSTIDVLGEVNMIPNNLPYIRTGGNGEAIDTVIPYPYLAPEINKKPGDSIIRPNMNRSSRHR